jgi:hypothetical protein
MMSTTIDVIAISSIATAIISQPIFCDITFV